MSKFTCYHASGVLIAAERSIPEMTIASWVDPAEADICISWGDSIEAPPGVPGDIGSIKGTTTTKLVTLPGVGCFTIAGGREVVVNAGLGVDPVTLRQYILGTALPAVLYQRSIMSLHISAVVTPSGVWAFTGASGAGKSTLASLLNARNGWPFVSDDTASLIVKDGLPLVHSGIHRIKLTEYVAEVTGLREKAGTSIEYRGKRHVNSPRQFVAEPLPLRALVELSCADMPTLTTISGLEAARLYLKTLYRPDLMRTCVPTTFNLMQFLKSMSPVRTFAFARPWRLNDDASLRLLEEQIHAD